MLLEYGPCIQCTYMFLYLQTGKTALHLAARGSFVTIVDMIIKAERYFSINRVSVNSVDTVNTKPGAHYM